MENVPAVLDTEAGGYDPRYCGAPHTTAWLFFVVFWLFVTGLLFKVT